ncbi:MAG: dihydropteroate synthase [Thaumarchaeota archaeon]|nr:dihydropteroate synthase [Nitrososphaerota archaeon]
MNKLGPVSVGGKNPIRIMGILNVSPESFYKKSIKQGRAIRDAIQQMENDGADFVDIGGMSTAPYLSTLVSEKEETKRIINAIKHIQNTSNLPISVDTCRSSVAKTALEYGADIINDISGLKYDKNMIHVIEKHRPSLILCAYGQSSIKNPITQVRHLLKQSLDIASNIPKNNIAIDPAIGFFRKTGKNPFFTKIKTDWVARDLTVLQNLSSLKLDLPILISVSNKSFIGKILNKDPQDRLYGSIAAEAISVLNGADIMRTHNVSQTKDAILIAQKLSKQIRKGL